MKIRLFFIFILSFSNVYARHNCESIVENMRVCKEYSCRQFIDSKNFIEHKILGLNNEGLCVYVERQDGDEMICHHSQYGIMAEKKYFQNIFNQEIDDFIDITDLRAKECFFVSNQNTDRDNIIKEAVDSDIEIFSKYNDVKSIFFDEKSIDKMINELEKFNLGSQATVKQESTENFNCKVVSLDSILYLSADVWKIWVNGKLFIDTKDLKVYSVTENHVTFVWTID